MPADSYATTDDAEAYFADRLHTDAWDTATTPDKAKALRMATRLIDLQPFRGKPTTPGQPLAWPRTGLTDHSAGIAADRVPDAVKWACCEWAMHLLTNDPARPAPVVTSKKVGDLQTSYRPGRADDLPPMVRRLLAPFLASSAYSVELVP